METRGATPLPPLQPTPVSHGSLNRGRLLPPAEPQDTFTPTRGNREKAAVDPPKGRPGDLPAQNQPSSATNGRKLVEITILHTNDLHGRLQKLDDLSSTIKALRAVNPDAVLVDTGDVAYNPPYSDAHHYEPMPSFLNNNDYDITVPGNHEYQWGNSVAEKELFSKLQSDIICANVLDKATGKPFPYMKPYVIEEIKGVKVAFIGLTTSRMATDANPHVGKDLIVLDEKQTMAKYCEQVKAKGAEVVVVLTHQGLGRTAKAADIVEDADLIISGHDHELTKTPLVVNNFPRKTYIVEAGSRAEFIGQTTLYVDSETRKVIEVQSKPIPTRHFVVDGGNGAREQKKTAQSHDSLLPGKDVGDVELNDEFVIIDSVRLQKSRGKR